jgi:hypothetical protein
MRRGLSIVVAISASPDCAAASFATLTRAIGGELVVYDKP